MLRKNHKKNRVAKAFIVVLTIAVTAIGKVLLERVLGEGPPLLLFIPSVIFSAYFGGFWTGIGATFVAALTAVYFFLPPLFELRVNSENDQFRLAVFTCISLIICYLFERLHAHEFVLESKNEELEASARALADSNSQLKRFAAVASHDLQEPIRAITTFLALLEKRTGAQLDGESLQYIAFAKDGATRLSLLVRDLLRHSQLESETISQTATDCETVMKNVVSNLGAMIEERGATVKYAGLPVVRTNPGMLEELLQNLVSNAIKYHGNQPPEVSITATANERSWLFTVRDNGEGIAIEAQSRIFEMFQRLHGQDIPGTGIGLATCKMIVERLQGKIWLQSRPHEGSTFFFSLPTEA